MTSHLILLNLGILVSLYASQGIDSTRDLVKNLWQKLTTTRQSYPFLN